MVETVNKTIRFAPEEVEALGRIGSAEGKTMAQLVREALAYQHPEFARIAPKECPICERRYPWTGEHWAKTPSGKYVCIECSEKLAELFPQA